VASLLPQRTFLFSLSAKEISIQNSAVSPPLSGAWDIPSRENGIFLPPPPLQGLTSGGLPRIFPLSPSLFPPTLDRHESDSLFPLFSGRSLHFLLGRKMSGTVFCAGAFEACFSAEPRAFFVFSGRMEGVRASPP